MVLVVHTCLIQKMRKVRLRLREIYSLARWNPMELYSSLCIRIYGVIFLGYTGVPGFNIGGHLLLTTCHIIFILLHLYNTIAESSITSPSLKTAFIFTSCAFSH